MYSNNLKKLRNECEISQKELSEQLNFNRNNYKNWELGIVMIPLAIADQLSVYYNVRLSYILGIDNNYNDNKKIKKMNYKKMLSTLNSLKTSRKVSFEIIATYIDCAKSTCHDYFKGKTTIPLDRLIALSDFFDIDLDKLCGKD